MDDPNDLLPVESWTPGDWCLAVFVVTVLVNLAGLSLDYWLLRTGRETISQHVWARPWLGAPVVAWQLLGALALAGHFWWRR